MKYKYPQTLVDFLTEQEGEDTYTHVNLMDKALNRFKMIIKEMENK